MTRDTAPEEVLDGDALPADIELEAPFREDEITPVVRVCPDCAGEAVVLDDDVQPPALPSEAHRDRHCRGTRDAARWRLCMSAARADDLGPGLLTLPGQEGMRVLMDRRRVRR